VAEADTKELDALLSSLKSSAERFQTLWLWLVGATFYLWITALGTTHRALLLAETPSLTDLDGLVKQLPFYISGPLSFVNSQFFVIAPLLYLVFHFYVILMLLPFAITAAAFEQNLRTAFPFQVDQKNYRNRVENSLFQQMLVGGEVRANFETIGLVTIGLGPIATLVVMQMMFLPDHSLTTTWWHRFLVVSDLAFIFLVWRRYLQRIGRGKRSLAIRELRLSDWLRVVLILCFVSVVLWLCLWEGRWAGEPLIGRGDLDATIEGVVFGLFPDRLRLRQEIIVGNDGLEQANKESASRNGGFVPTRNFGGRDLEAAQLFGADLRGVFLGGAAMTRTDLRGALLDGALLDKAQLDGANLGGTRLQGATLFQTSLRGADLEQAQLQGADLADAQLQGANLSRAQLQGADLSGTLLAESAFEGTFVFRTAADPGTAAVRSVRPDKVFFGEAGEIKSLTPLDVHAWIAAATQFVRNENKTAIAQRFARLTPDFQTLEMDAEDQARWNDSAKQTLAIDPDGAQYRRRLADRLGDLACTPSTRPMWRGGWCAAGDSRRARRWRLATRSTACVRG
jgi:Pentapeptide repeats (8 copies)